MGLHDRYYGDETGTIQLFEERKTKLDELIEYLESVIDEEGCFKLPDGFEPLGDNKIKLLAEYYLMLKKLGRLTPEMKARYKKTIKSLWAVDLEGKTRKGLYTRQPNQNYEGGDYNAKEIDQHDNGFSIAALSKIAAFWIALYGYTHFLHFDVRTWTYLRVVEQRSIWESMKEHFRCMRQPYQMAAYSTCGTGLTDPISFIHLCLVAVLQVIKPIKGSKKLFGITIKGDTSGKLLMWSFAESTFGMGWIPALIYKGLMRATYGKRWFQDTMYEYNGQYPDTRPVQRALYELSEELLKKDQ